MKIGILTFHNARNFGAVLQTMALQNYIKSIDNDKVEIIDYHNERLKEVYTVKIFKRGCKFKSLIKNILFYTVNCRNKDIFDNFINKYCMISEKQYNKSNIYETDDIYDKIFVGSDQIWNFQLTGNDYSYFLDFSEDKNKKVAYAASFGNKRTLEKYSNNVCKYISDFSYVSLREDKVCSSLSKLIDKEIYSVLDPVFLMDKKFWIDFESDIKQENEYILLYIVAPGKEILQFTKNLAKKYNCEIIYINPYRMPCIGMKNLRNVTVEKFLGYIKNAKFVITTSFHCTAFSIIFEKEFFIESSQNENLLYSRVGNLMDILNIKNRDVQSANIDSRIDYDIVNKILDKKIKKSKDFINKCLEK